MGELRLEHLTRVFPNSGNRAAVDDLSITVHAGECVALLGPSGAGKSTVLRLIAGLDSPTGGRVSVDHESIAALPPGDRGVSMAFQAPALLPQLTVDENLCLGAKLRGRQGFADRAGQISDLLGIASLRSRRPETLSGGEQQRVALGRALMAEPRVLLLDEPLASLDPIARLELREAIRRVQKELKLTTLYVTHDQGEAAAVADRIAILRGGRLEQFASSLDLYQDPANLFVARFFGADGLNLLDGRIDPAQPADFEAGGVCFALARPLSADVRGGGLCLGFRPSSVQVLRSSAGEWTVHERRDLGWVTVVKVARGRQELKAWFPGETPLVLGDPVQVKVDPGRLMVFDAGSGRRCR